MALEMETEIRDGGGKNAYFNFKVFLSRIFKASSCQGKSAPKSKNIEHLDSQHNGRNGGEQYKQKDVKQ